MSFEYSDFIKQCYTMQENDRKLNEENRKLKDENNELRNEIKKLKDEIIKLKDLNKETEQEPENIVDAGIQNIESVEGKTIETKDDNGLIENKSGEETQGIKNHENITEKRGLVVICTHSTFDSGQNLLKRPGAYHDFTMMKNVWESFECKVVEFSNMQTSFYELELTKAIEAELKNITDSKFFVFVLSTHGETHEETDLKSTKHSSQHIFFTEDGQFGTYDLMKNISKIEMLKTKPKIFVIQACRTKAQEAAVDLGHVIEFTSLFGFNNSDKTKSGNDITFFEVNKSRNVKMIFTGTSKEVSSNDNLSIEDIPLCEESVLLFSTTSGKYAFQTIHGDKSGGLAIRALHTIMTEAEVGAKLHITDILTRVNYDVQKEQILCTMEPGVPLTPDLVLTDEMTKIDCQQRLENHVNELIQLCNLCISSAEIKEYNHEDIKKYKHEEIKKYSHQLEALRERISNKNNTKDILLDLKNKVNKTSSLITDIEKAIPIKCQSCFYHNLSIDTDEVYLQKVK